MTKDDQLLEAAIQDKIKAAKKRCSFVNTGFLDLSSQAVAQAAVKSCGLFCCFYGGYEDAERRVLVVDGGREPAANPGADYAFAGAAAEYESLLSVVRISIPKGSSALSHRDYLGSILALGIKRDVTGDIIVRDDGADVICLADMAEFICRNLLRIGRSNAACSVHSAAELNTGSVRTEEFRDTLASLRIDAAAASVFKMSRANAQEAVKQGIVCINNRQVTKPDTEISEGDKISMRGKGKAVLEQIGGRSRKDRICVVFRRYL